MNGSVYSEYDTCPECNSSEVFLDEERGERVCNMCGLVLVEREIDRGPEWRAFTSDERRHRSRVGSPSTYTVHDKGLSTNIDWRDKDAFGNKIPPQQRAQIYRMRKWQVRSRVQSSLDRNLATAMNELDRITSQLGLSRSVKEHAALVYRKSIERKLIRGRSIEALVATAVYMACRVRKTPRTLVEVALHSRIERKELGRCYRLMVKEMAIAVPAVSPVDFVSRIGSDLMLSGRTQRVATIILERAKRAGITTGKDPTGLAAAAIYVAAIMEGERRTQRDIAKKARVTEVTVRNRYKEIVRHLALPVQV